MNAWRRAAFRRGVEHFFDYGEEMFMKFTVIFLAVFSFVCGCQTISSKVEEINEKQFADNAETKMSGTKYSSIRQVDFQNFTFPATKNAISEEESFTLKNGIFEREKDEKLSLHNISYFNVTEDDGAEAFVSVTTADTNATYETLYIFAIENNQPKLLESFTFGDGVNTHFATAFAAYGELIIESYRQTANDAECCPSIIEIAYYKWQKDKFVLQGAPQKVANGYVERLKKQNEKN